MILLGACSPASADSSPSAQTQQPPPTATFLDERPLEVDVAKVINDGGLSLDVRNDLDRSQRIEVRVAGLQGAADAVIAHLFRSDSVTSAAALAPGESQTLELKTSPSALVAKPGSFEVSLLASGESGGFDRRTLTLTVTA